ncbi:MAG TPA: hypothetical protein VGQ59_20265, partial [Cyclobacteriaceae bacterium]|nr:hypothetical protein [Cyclobacteriaceae bacterium]
GVFELIVDRSEINPYDATEGNTVSVYYHPDFKKVYLRKPRESLMHMPVNKVLNPFLFWSGATILPFPIFFYVYLRYWRKKKIEKERLKANPRERWIE